MATLLEILAAKKAAEAQKVASLQTAKEEAHKKFLESTKTDFTTNTNALLKQEIATQMKKLSFAELVALKKANEQRALEDHLIEYAGSEDSLHPSLIEATETITVPYTDVLSQSATAPESLMDSFHDAKTFALDIELNDRQLIAKDYAFQGKNFCLTGAAGTGKTTTQRAIAQSLLASGALRTTDFKVQGSQERVQAPSIAFVAYTRRASANLQRAIHRLPELEEALFCNIMTIHALLEYQPVYYWDELEQKEKFRFEPQRHSGRPLSITHLVIEEATLVGLDLWEKLYDALPIGVQIIFLGDINQLPPVFGASIFNYALTQLPVIELIQVYRQGEGSPIIDNAHRVLRGESVVEDENEQGSFQIIRGKQNTQQSQERTSVMLGSLFKQFWEQDFYNPDTDIILTPWNKRELGSDNMNRWIAQFLGEKKEQLVYEIIAGFNKLYLAVGDKVMCNKQDGIIEKISVNGMYQGQTPQLAGQDLTRFGNRIIGHASGNGGTMDDILLGYTNFNVADIEGIDAQRKQQASHVITVRLETGLTCTLSNAGDFGPQVFSLGYVLTVHKAQGCEWRKVFLIMHKDHNVGGFLSRELFYTAITRARESIVVIAKDFVIATAIKNQKLKGNTLADKIEYFNSGAVERGYEGTISCTK